MIKVVTNQPLRIFPEMRKSFSKDLQHAIHDLIGAQSHHDLGENHNQGNDGETDIRPPSAECLDRLKPEEFHISDFPPVIFRKKSSRERWGENDETEIPWVTRYRFSSGAWPGSTRTSIVPFPTERTFTQGRLPINSKAG